MDLILSFWKGIAGAVLAAGVVLVAGAAVRAQSGPQSASAAPIVYVIAGGWHTEIDLPRASIDPPLAALTLRFPDARSLVFGWGARGFYMARHPGIEELMRAATPGPAVMLVIPLAMSPTAFAGTADVFPLAISPGSAARLSQFLWSDLVAGRNRIPRDLGPGPEPQSVFFAAAGTYDLSHTCNTWTAEALRMAGLPVNPAGVVFASQLLDQLRGSR